MVAEILPIFDFQYGGRPPSSVFEMCKFQLSPQFPVAVCVFTPNFVAIGRTVTKLFQFIDSQNIDCPVSSVFKVCELSLSARFAVTFCMFTQNFVSIG